VVAHTTIGHALLGSVHTTVPLDLPPVQRPPVEHDGFQIIRTVTLAEDARQLIVGVRDVRSWAIGTRAYRWARLRSPQ